MKNKKKKKKKLFQYLKFLVCLTFYPKCADPTNATFKCNPILAKGTQGS